MITTPPTAGRHHVVTTFLDVLGHEERALQRTRERLSADPEAIERVCRMLLEVANGQRTTPRIIVSGIGKSGLIARKVGATLSSTGTAAVFLHPVDALHGDLGAVQSEDCGLLFSYSGETGELNRLATELRRIGCRLVAITRSRTSTLGQIASACIEIGEIREACYMDLAPSSSTTAMLAVGDALALAVARCKGFEEQDFARNHPAGLLGLRFQHVRDFMRQGRRLVRVVPQTKLKDVVEQVSAARTGAAVVVNPDGSLIGIFTDGDLRRALLHCSNSLEEPIDKFATSPCRSLTSDASVAEALKQFRDENIEDLPVIDAASGKVSGMLCRKDIPLC